jgi:hypothetical protein
MLYRNCLLTLPRIRHYEDPARKYRKLGIEWNGVHQLLVHIDYPELLCGSVNT